MNTIIQSKTLCWECANACGNCSWSESLTPVEGWKAVWTEKETYMVLDCPEFVRDSTEGGLKRL